jgi:UDP-N-acetylglucosamine--N-acetylmuramyl-(pentapeptide) pyrophosphoryl-undecaprenol N-acetylglucosamine transferase
MSRRPVVLIAGGGTGGHLMPALAIASRLRECHPDIEPMLVGAGRGVEARVLPGRDFRFTLLPSEPVYRRTWWRNARWPMVAWRLRRALRQLFLAERPVAVLGTGGYASGPVVWWAARAGIPTAIQEQNAYPGLATRLLARRVNHVYLGVPEAKDRLKLSSGIMVFDTGNPIRPPDPARRDAALRKFGLDGQTPVLLVTGGSQGSRAINRAVAAWLEQRTSEAAKWQVLWVTGRGTHAEFARWHQVPAVRVIDFLDPMADAYAVSDLVIPRAGMMTVAELCAWGLPAVLIPLPTAAADHQTHNARVMDTAGAALMLAQSDMERDGLGPTVESLMADLAGRSRMAGLARARGRPDAAGDMVSLFVTLFAS